jgi:hypothetical protein
MITFLAVLLLLAVPSLLATAAYAWAIRWARKRNAALAALGNDPGIIGDEWKTPLETVSEYEATRFWEETLKAQTPDGVDTKNAKVFEASAGGVIVWNRTRSLLEDYLVGKRVITADGQAVDMLARYPEKAVPEEKKVEVKPQFDDDQLGKFFDVITDRAIEAVITRAVDRVAREVENRVHKTFMNRIEERVTAMLRAHLVEQMKEAIKEVQDDEAFYQKTVEEAKSQAV